MGNSLKAVINFDEISTRRQLENYYFYSWKKKLPTTIKYIILILIFLLGTDTFFNPERSRADFLQFLGIFLPVTSILYIIMYFFNKADYISKINTYIEDLKKFNNTTELYFDDVSFYIKSEQFDLRSIWKNVSYEMLKETMYIKIEIGSPFTYIIEKKETDQYNDIFEFLKNKSKSK